MIFLNGHYNWISISLHSFLSDFIISYIICDGLKKYRRYIYTLRCFENFDVGTCECERCGSVTSWQVSRKTLSIKIFLFTFYIITSVSVNKRVMIISSKSFTHIDMCINDVIQTLTLIRILWRMLAGVY